MGTPRSIRKKREEARRLYLSGECETNAEIARRLKLKPHTVGKWRRDEDWEGLPSQHSRERHLPSRRRDEIAAADDQRDVLTVVVDGCRELIGPVPVAIADQEIAVLVGR